MNINNEIEMKGMEIAKEALEHLLKESTKKRIDNRVSEYARSFIRNIPINIAFDFSKLDNNYSILPESARKWVSKQSYNDIKYRDMIPKGIMSLEDIISNLERMFIVEELMIFSNRLENELKHVKNKKRIISKLTDAIMGISIPRKWVYGRSFVWEKSLRLPDSYFKSGDEENLREETLQVYMHSSTKSESKDLHEVTEELPDAIATWYDENRTQVLDAIERHFLSSEVFDEIVDGVSDWLTEVIPNAKKYEVIRNDDIPWDKSGKLLEAGTIDLGELHSMQSWEQLTGESVPDDDLEYLWNHVTYEDKLRELISSMIERGVQQVVSEQLKLTGKPELRLPSNIAALLVDFDYPLHGYHLERLFTRLLDHLQERVMELPIEKLVRQDKPGCQEEVSRGVELL